MKFTVLFANISFFSLNVFKHSLHFKVMTPTLYLRMRGFATLKNPSNLCNLARFQAIAIWQGFRAFEILHMRISSIRKYAESFVEFSVEKLVVMLDVAYVTLQIRKYIQEIYGSLQQFSEISDFKIRDFNKISKRAVRDFKPGVADPSYVRT